MQWNIYVRSNLLMTANAVHGVLAAIFTVTQGITSNPLVEVSSSLESNCGNLHRTMKCNLGREKNVCVIIRKLFNYTGRCRGVCYARYFSWTEGGGGGGGRGEESISFVRKNSASGNREKKGKAFWFWKCFSLPWKRHDFSCSIT